MFVLIMRLADTLFAPASITSLSQGKTATVQYLAILVFCMIHQCSPRPSQQVAASNPGTGTLEGTWTEKSSYMSWRHVSGWQVCPGETKIWVKTYRFWGYNRQVKSWRKELGSTSCQQERSRGLQTHHLPALSFWGGSIELWQGWWLEQSWH